MKHVTMPAPATRPRVDVRVVVCDCGCDTAYVAAFVNGQPVETVYEVANSSMAEFLRGEKILTFFRLGSDGERA